MSTKNLYLNLKKFKFKKFLGNGSFGKVDLVEDIETKVKYAAKISKDEFEDRLVEEDMFWEYVDFVDNFNEIFDLKRQSIHLNTFINPKTKGFKRFSIRYESNKVVEIISEDEFNKIQENSLNQSNAKADSNKIKQNTTNRNIEISNNEIYNISQNCTVNANSIILEEKGSLKKAEKDLKLSKENDYLPNKDDDKIKEQQMKTIKLKALFLGKMSTHVLSYLTKGPMAYVPSVFDNLVVKFVVNDKINVNLQLWDTVGEIPGDIAVLEFTNTDIFVLVYSLIDRSSLEYYQKFKIAQIRKYVRKPVFFMIGVELEKWKNDQNNQDYISQKEIEFFEKEFSVVDSVKVSLDTYENFDHIYDKIILAHLHKLNILKPNNISKPNDKCSIY